MRKYFSFYSVFLAFLIGVQCTSVLNGQNEKTDNGLSVGDFKIYKLQDAQMYLQLSLLSGIEHKDASTLIGGSDSAWTPVNSYLVKTPNHIVLVDAGVGIYPGEDSGHLLDQMKKIGINPLQVDIILITHFHFDHIGGLISPEGKPMFPNASIRVSKLESDYWMQDLSNMPENQRERAKMVKKIFDPYIKAKLYQTFLPNEEFGDGIRALSAYGHTIGHTVYSFSSKGVELWCIGDLIHFGAIQFKHPEAALMFDSDMKIAIASRISVFKRAAASHIILAGAHLPEMVQLDVNGDLFVAVPFK